MVSPRQNLIGSRLKEARKLCHPRVTQEELSRRLSDRGVQIDRSGIAKIESGIRGVLDFELVALADSVGISVTWLLGLPE